MKIPDSEPRSDERAPWLVWLIWLIAIAWLVEFFWPIWAILRFAFF